MERILQSYNHIKTVLYNIFQKYKTLWKIFSLIVGFLFAIISLQVAVPIFAPIIDISLGNEKFGIVYDNYTMAYRGLNIDVRPPLYLTNWDYFNCQEYNLLEAIRMRGWATDPSLKPLKVGVLNQIPYSGEIPAPFYRTLRVCLNSDSQLNAWKLGKLSTSIYLDSIQPLAVGVSDGSSFDMIGDNNGKIFRGDIRQLTNHSYFEKISFANYENFPISIWADLEINNKTNEILRYLVISKECKKNIVVYPAIELNNLTKINEPQEITREEILNNDTITLGKPDTYFNMGQLEPYQTKIYYLIFECE